MEKQEDRKQGDQQQAGSHAPHANKERKWIKRSRRLVTFPEGIPE
jgi:hypothetical protein